MEAANKSSTPILTGAKLEFFYSILTPWESGEENKVVNDFKSSEVKRFLNKRDSKGVKIIFFTTDTNKNDFGRKYRLYVKDSKGNQGKSLLYHLRNAFAHNDIQLSNNRNNICINHKWKGTLKLKTNIPFKVLKELVETIRGQHNLTVEENKKKSSKKRKSK